MRAAGMSVVCCKWSCIVCRALVTRSSETCPDMDRLIPEESSHPFQAPPQPCFNRVLPCHWACSGRKGTGRRVQVQGHLAFRIFSEKKGGKQVAANQDGQVGRPWRVQRTSALAHRRGWRCGNHHTSKVCLSPSSFFSPGVFLLRLSFCIAWQPYCERSFLLHVFLRCESSVLCRVGSFHAWLHASL